MYAKITNSLKTHHELLTLINFCLKQDKCLKQGIKNRNSVLNRVRKSAIFVLNRVSGTAPPPPTQGYIDNPPPPGVTPTLLSELQY